MEITLFFHVSVWNITYHFRTSDAGFQIRAALAIGPRARVISSPLDCNMFFCSLCREEAVRSTSETEVGCDDFKQVSAIIKPNFKT